MANLTKTRREMTQIGNQYEIGEITQTPRKFRGSSGTTLRTYIQINWKT
jgi:hypothetical protein